MTVTMEMKRPKSPRNIRLCRSQRRINQAPVLTLEGLWLKDMGFNIGDLVQITPGDEELTIKIVEKWKSVK